MSGVRSLRSSTSWPFTSTVGPTDDTPYEHVFDVPRAEVTPMNAANTAARNARRTSLARIFSISRPPVLAMENARSRLLPKGRSRITLAAPEVRDLPYLPDIGRSDKCTGGVSSVRPVVLVNGQLFADQSDLTPSTEVCVPQ